MQEQNKSDSKKKLDWWKLVKQVASVVISFFAGANIF